LRDREIKEERIRQTECVGNRTKDSWRETKTERLRWREVNIMREEENLKRVINL
jgi:hypothetical protein